VCIFKCEEGLNEEKKIEMEMEKFIVDCVGIYYDFNFKNKFHTVLFVGLTTASSKKIQEIECHLSNKIKSGMAEHPPNSIKKRTLK
jgi:hypothetical protein